VRAGLPAVELAQKIDAGDGLRFAGLQAYHGSAQHVYKYAARKGEIDQAIKLVTDTVELLKNAGLDCDTIGGAGTGTYQFEGTSKVFNELQCGSYIFMDADYQKVRNADDTFISEFKNSLFVYTSIMSHVTSDKAICDAGMKAHSIDSGLPVIFGRDDITYTKCGDEHGFIADPTGVLKLNDKLKLIPGHCDPTCNLYDWYVGIRNDTVECLWPVTARGLSF
jgi:3-hydroxy-D-aspartate aldolase